ncbi:MAG: phospholipase effector Tle1 domain-containing protein [Allosphingosinicella sp.]
MATQAGEAPGPRRLVVCLDGTGNEIGVNLSNVLKLYRCLDKSEGQLVYYDPGVGTIGQPGWWRQLGVKVRGFLGLAVGLGLDENVLRAYAWLCRTWREGDEIFLFGFSRGAYTARVLAGFIRLIGLLRSEQANLCGYALVAYKKSGDTGDFKVGGDFARVAGSRLVTIRFVGVWDTVSSVLTPNAKLLFLPWPLTLPFTRKNARVEIFRHAISVDEKRRMFRVNHWQDPQPFKPDPYDGSKDRPQDIRQVWFAGVHSDVGGGYPEAQSALSKYPLLWMIGEAAEAGLAIDQQMLAWLTGGAVAPDEGNRFPYVPPSPEGERHHSLTGPWWLLEIFPKLAKLKEWPGRIAFLGLYIPWAEPRPIPNRPWQGKPSDTPFLVHSSLLARIAELPGYRPVNLPAHFEVEEAWGPKPPVIPPPPYRGQGLGARLRRLLATWPGAKEWGAASAEALWLVPALAILAWLGGFLHTSPLPASLGLPLGLAALLALAFGEETLFRGVLLKPPPIGTSALGPAALSAALFTLWHPLQRLACHWLWADQCPLPWARLACSFWFLAACFALGFACARAVLKTRSIWPAVALHWIVLAAWVAFTIVAG